MGGSDMLASGWSHGGNTGSNPVGDANNIKCLKHYSERSSGWYGKYTE
jgi:hypothetical protein